MPDLNKELILQALNKIIIFISGDNFMVDLIDKLTNEEKQDVKQIKVDKNSALHQMIKAYELGLELYQEPNIIHIYEIGNFLSKKFVPL